MLCEAIEVGKSKTCTLCKVAKPLDHFFKNGGGKLASRCRICSSLRPPRKRTIKDKQRTLENAATRKRERLSGENRAQYIWEDCRKTDKRAGRENDLDREFIEHQLQFSCTYCDAPPDRFKMTLDRIDNSRGHTKDNVNISCYRCNLIRGAMPYEAWLTFVPALRHCLQNELMGEYRLAPLRRGHKGKSTAIPPTLGPPMPTNVNDEVPVKEEANSADEFFRFD